MWNSADFDLWAAGAFSAAKSLGNDVSDMFGRGEIDVVNPSGLGTGIAEVALQTRVIANRLMWGLPIWSFLWLHPFWCQVRDPRAEWSHGLR